MTAHITVDGDARERIEGALGQTLFVEASAGTGKTTALVRRVLSLVRSGTVEMRHVAAITFTEKAAAELRDRVRQGLEHAAADPDLSPDDRARCRGGVSQVDHAAILTLHGFAHRLLAEHPLEAGLPPAFEVLDEVRSSLDFADRWERTFTDVVADPEVEAALLRGLVLGLKPDVLREVARGLERNWDFLEAVELRPATLPPLDVGTVVAPLREAIACRGWCSADDDRLAGRIDSGAAWIERLDGARDDLETLHLLTALPTLRGSGCGKATNWRDGDIAYVRGRCDAAEEARHTLLGDTARAVLDTLLAALARATLHAADERRRQGRLEFHDLLVHARRLLRDHHAVRASARDRYQRLLIDEFQDTDPLQIEIALLLAAADAKTEEMSRLFDISSVSAEPGRLFFVGDAKQSIYRFRRADIAVFHQARAAFAEGAEGLVENFRTVPGIVDWVNTVFAEQMAAGQGAGQAPYAPLHAHRGPLQDSSPPVMLLGRPHEDASVEVVREREAADVAATIRRVKAEQWAVSERQPDGSTTERPARYADVAILLPTRASLPQLEQALEDAEIPYRVDTSSLVYSTQEVRDLLAVLRSIDDPTDEVALLTALRSAAFACADDALLAYRRAGGRWSYLASDEPEGPASVVSALRWLRAAHQGRWWLSTSQIVDRVVRERRLLELACVHRRPRDHWRRLRFVVDQARAFEEAAGGGLRDFIAWAELQADERARVAESVVPDRDDDAVRILTIHGAKGLEFPVTIVSGLNSASASGGSVRLLWGDTGRPEVRLGAEKAGFETAGFRELAARERQLEAYEDVRLLYVAATRARDHLIVSLHHKAGGAETHAHRLHALCEADTGLWAGGDVAAAVEEPSLEPAVIDRPGDRETWLEARAERIRGGTAPAVVAATAVARGMAEDAPAAEGPWRRGRAGTAIGRAVHAVLQTVDLDSGEGLADIARAQAAAEGIPALARRVERLSRSAFDADAVQAARRTPRRWRELYVAAPIEGVLVEGFVDLLYEEDGDLVVVDFKTDQPPDDAALDQLAARYRPQAAAYALALGEGVGRPVRRCVFVFVGEQGARERTVSGAELTAALADVRGALPELAGA